MQLSVPGTCNPGETVSHSSVPTDSPHDCSIVCSRDACFWQSPVGPTPKIDTPGTRSMQSYTLANTVVVGVVVAEVVWLVVCEVVTVDVAVVVGVEVTLVVGVVVDVVVGEVV